MRGWEKLALWTFILLICAGVGAFVASRSNPFPPEVRDRSSSPTSSTSPSPSAELPERWRLTLVSRTTREYHVGGSCTSDWRMRARINVAAEGEIAGHGVAHLLPGAGCDFPTAQVQATDITLRITGERSGMALELRLAMDGIQPPGAQDLGGFVRTIRVMRLSVREREGAGDRERSRVEDPEDEFHTAVTTLVLSR